MLRRLNLKEMGINYYIFGGKREIDIVLFNDIKNLENAKYTYIGNQFNIIEKFINRVYCSDKIARFINMPWKKIWFQIFLNKIPYDRNNKIIFVFFTDWFEIIDRGFVEFLKKNFKSAIYVSYNVDIHGFRKSCFDKIRDQIDESFIFDKVEAQKAGISYYPLPMSKFEIGQNKNEEKSDIFFVGYVKTRYKKLIDVYDRCVEIGLKPEFYILGVEEDDQIYRENIHYIEYMPYIDTLKVMSRSKCELELLVQGCTSYSQRVFDALIYDKKVITDNLALKDEEFYDPNQILIFDDINKISLSFFEIGFESKRHYAEKLSPIKFLEYLSQRYDMR